MWNRHVDKEKKTISTNCCERSCALVCSLFIKFLCIISYILLISSTDIIVTLKYEYKMVVKSTE